MRHDLQVHQVFRLLAASSNDYLSTLPHINRLHEHLQITQIPQILCHLGAESFVWIGAVQHLQI